MKNASFECEIPKERILQPIKMRLQRQRNSITIQYASQQQKQHQQAELPTIQLANIFNKLHSKACQLEKSIFKTLQEFFNI